MIQAELDYCLIEGHLKNHVLMAIYITKTFAMEPENGVPYDCITQWKMHLSCPHFATDLSIVS